MLHTTYFTPVFTWQIPYVETNYSYDLMIISCAYLMYLVQLVVKKDTCVVNYDLSFRATCTRTAKSAISNFSLK